MQNAPTMRQSRGINAIISPFEEVIPGMRKKEKIMKAVAFVGPRIVCREPEKKGATIAATAEHAMPYAIGSSAIAA